MRGKNDLIPDDFQTLADEQFVGVPFAAKYLDISRSSVYQLMNNGSIKYAKFGKCRRISLRTLREFAASCAVGGA
jgi:excisionase family DNA binding protein